MLRSDPEEYKTYLLSKLEREERKAIYLVNEELTQTVASYVNRYFDNHKGFAIEMRKCARCRNQWDIIIRKI